MSTILYPSLLVGKTERGQDERSESEARIISMTRKSLTLKVDALKAECT